MKPLALLSLTIAVVACSSAAGDKPAATTELPLPRFGLVITVAADSRTDVVGDDSIQAYRITSDHATLITVDRADPQIDTSIDFVRWQVDERKGGRDLRSETLPDGWWTTYRHNAGMHVLGVTRDLAGKRFTCNASGSEVEVAGALAACLSLRPG